MQFRTRHAILYWPLATSDEPRALPPGTIVTLVRVECATRLLVTEGGHQPFHVATSEVEECLNVHTLSPTP